MNKGVKRWINWAKDNECIVLTGMQRSGRHWLRRIIQEVSGLQGTHPPGVENYNDYFFLQHDHWGDMSKRINNPDVKYILLVRDPRDAILSWSKAWWIHNNDKHEKMKERYVQDIIDDGKSTIWNMYLDQYLPLSNSFLIQYEAICLTPQPTLRRLLEFLNTPQTRPVYEVIEELDSRKKKRLLFEGDEFRSVEFDTDYERYEQHCKKWRRSKFFTETHNKQIWEVCKEKMKELGYTKEGHNLGKLKGM